MVALTKNYPTSITFKARSCLITVEAVTTKYTLARGAYQPRWTVHIRENKVRVVSKNFDTLSEVKTYVLDHLHSLHNDRIAYYERFTTGRKPGKWRAPKIDLSALDESMPLAKLAGAAPHYAGHGKQKHESKRPKLFPNVDWTKPYERPHVEPDGTCPYMIENQRGLSAGQDWLYPVYASYGGDFVPDVGRMMYKPYVRLHVSGRHYEGILLDTSGMFLYDDTSDDFNEVWPVVVDRVEVIAWQSVMLTPYGRWRLALVQREVVLTGGDLFRDIWEVCWNGHQEVWEQVPVRVK